MVHQTVIASRDLEESRARSESPRRVPPPPDFADVSDRNTFVPRSHDDGDRAGGGIVVVLQDRETLEETSPERHFPPLRVVKESERISGGKLLDPPVAEADRRRNQEKRRADSPAVRVDRDERSKRAPDDDRRPVAFRLEDGDPHHRLEVQVEEGRHVQVGSDHLRNVVFQKRPQRRNLPASWRGREAVEVEDLLHVSTEG